VEISLYEGRTVDGTARDQSRWRGADLNVGGDRRVRVATQQKARQNYR